MNNVFDFDPRKRKGQRAGLPFTTSLSLSRNFKFILLATFICGHMVWMQVLWPQLFAIAFVVLLFVTSVCIHEFGHAYIALKGGDTSILHKPGYLSLDPLAYVDRQTSLLLPMLYLALGGIPLPGGAVYVNADAIRSRAWRSFMSAAGILFNTVMLIPVVIIYLLFRDYGPSLFWSAIAFFIYLEIACILLNLLPVPTLDGYSIVEEYLPANIQRFCWENQRWFPLVVIGLLIVPNPLMQLIFRSSYQLAELVGVSLAHISAGRRIFSLSAPTSAPAAEAALSLPGWIAPLGAAVVIGAVVLVQSRRGK